MKTQISSKYIVIKYGAYKGWYIYKIIGESPDKYIAESLGRMLYFRTDLAFDSSPRTFFKEKIKAYTIDELYE